MHLCIFEATSQMHCWATDKSIAGDLPSGPLIPRGISIRRAFFFSRITVRIFPGLNAPGKEQECEGDKHQQHLVSHGVSLQDDDQGNRVSHRQPHYTSRLDGPAAGQNPPNQVFCRLNCSTRRKRLVLLRFSRWQREPRNSPIIADCDCRPGL